MVKSVFLLSILLFIGGLTKAQEDTISFSAPQKLPESVNSTAEEGFPLLSSDGSRLYLARTFHPANKGGKYSGQDIWISNISNGDFSEAESLSELNDEWSNVVVGISKDGKRLYLLNKSSSDLETLPGVSVSVFNEDEGSWGNPVPVEIPDLEIKAGFYCLYVDSDEEFILWSLPTAEEDSLGNDLYVSVKTNDTWSAPQGLGAAINTDGDEITPFYDKATGLLFFSTNAREEKGNYDIYYAKKLSEDWLEWSMPAKADFNSNAFDAYFYLTPDSSGYFASNRNDSLSDIYITDVIITSPSMEELAAEEDTSQATEQDMEVIVETGGSENKNKGITTMTKEELLDEETLIRVVYFDYDKYNITASYVEILDDVASILDKYPDLYVKIEGHTDAVASEAYNQILSDNRASSVKEWLVINGIEPDRVKTEGFGESVPYASNATEEGRAKNRRVEIFFREIK